MDIYIMQTQALIEALSVGQNTNASVNLGTFMRNMVETVNSSCYEYTGYLSNIYDVDSYFKANMDMLDPKKFNSLLYSNQKIYTKLKNEVPTYYSNSSDVENSQFASGSMIEGTVKDSLISRQAFVKEGAVVENSILLANNEIGEGAIVRHAILDKNVAVEPGVKVIGTPTNPVVLKKDSYVITDIYGGE